MAKFTTTIDLNLEYHGHHLVGTAGTTHRLPDSLRAAFADDYGTRIPISWIVPDEIAVGGGSHPDLATHNTLGLATQDELDAHEIAADPHTGYVLVSELTTHAAAADPHTGYQRESEKGVADGYASLDGTGTVPVAQIPAAIARDTEVTQAVSDHVGLADPHTQYALDTDLTGHADDTTAIHGIASTALLETIAGAAAQIAVHAATPHGGSLPAGLIVMWGGAVSAIPSGWLLCDGNNGTPDLRSKFVKGAAAGQNPGATGGAATHTHADHAALSHSGAAVADHASHTHTYTQSIDHVHTLATGTGTTGNFSQVVGTVDTSSGGTGGTPTQTALGTRSGNPVGSAGATGTTAGPSATLTHSVTQPSQHAAQTHDSPNSEPPYYALCFIQKT